MKIRERKATRFGSGGTAAVLMLIVGVMQPLTWSESFRNWFAGEVRRSVGGWSGSFAWTLLVAVVMVTGVAAVLIAERHKRRLQPLRDLEGSLDGPNALYLRPYFTDAAVPMPNPFHSNWYGPVSLEARVTNPEQFVGRVLEPYINVRQVGGSPSLVGNARIRFFDEEWKGGIKEAIHAASVIIVMPLMKQDRNSGVMRGEATIWELQYLAESGWMERTIVLMPHVNWGARRMIRKAWEEARARVVEFALELPPYDDGGGVLVFSRTGGWWRLEKLFAPVDWGKERVAVGLVEALRWMSERFGFALLDR